MDSLDAFRRGSEAGLRAVVSAADEVIAAIDGKEVACVLAIKCPEDTPGERTSGHQCPRGVHGNNMQGGAYISIFMFQAKYSYSRSHVHAYPTPHSEAKKSRRECEDRKSALIDALHRKCKALLELSESSLPVNTSVLGTGDVNAEDGRGLPAVTGSVTGGLTAELISGAVQAVDDGIKPVVEGSGSGSKVDQEFKDTFSDLRKWVDTGADVQYASLHAANEIRAER